MTTETQTTGQAPAKILILCKNNGTTLDELLKLPVLDADEKINMTLLPMKIMSTEPSAADLDEGEIAFVVEA